MQIDGLKSYCQNCYFCVTKLSSKSAVVNHYMKGNFQSYMSEWLVLTKYAKSRLQKKKGLVVIKCSGILLI